MNIPILYDENNLITSATNPSGVTVTNTRLAAYYRRYLLQKAMSVFKWNLPEQWSERYFKYCLYVFGTCAVINVPKFGVIPQQCTLSGYNVFYQPAEVVIANPLFNLSKPLTIGKDCVLFTMTEDYSGIIDMVNYYADMMALVSESSAVNLFNSKLAYVFTADSQSVAQSFKKAADKVLSGEPYVVVDKHLTDDAGELKLNLFEQNLSQNFIAPDMLAMLKDIENQFATAVGIPNSNTEKKERLITDEVNANNVETYGRADMWLDNWKKSCKEVKDMFGVDISVDWRYKPESEVQTNANERNTITDRTVSVG